MQIISEKLEVDSEVIKFKEYVSDKTSETKIELEKNREMDKGIKPKEQHIEMGGFSR